MSDDKHALKEQLRNQRNSHLEGLSGVKEKLELQKKKLEEMRQSKAQTAPALPAQSSNPPTK